MISKNLSPSTQLPSFSIIVETENLATASLDGLSSALVALEEQDISPTQAQEVWLIEGGQVPESLLTGLQKKFPWIKVHSAPFISHYYEAKMLGAKLCTGEIIVYCDSDCLYERRWLRMLLTPFSQNPQIQVIAGETTTNGRGAYGLAMGFTYIFPNYSQETALTPTSQYFLNNVAFRRKFLLEQPIPLNLPLYRGHCVIHAQKLQSLGYQIWKQPQSRAKHAPPSDLSHFFWRFLLIGHDYYWQNRLMKGETIINKKENPAFGWEGKLKAFRARFADLILDKPENLIYLPLGIPIAIASVLLMLVGYGITAINPKFLLATYNNINPKNL
jgi:glycosyltransferase involved in cell wall biosynthesis